MFSDRGLINRRNVTGDVTSSYRPNRDYLWIVLKSRVITAAMTVLGFESKSSMPTKFPLLQNVESLKKSEKLECLHELSAKIVDKFVFQDGAPVRNFVDSVLLEQERERVY